jgi:lysophospholipase L1-like esterase
MRRGIAIGVPGVALATAGGLWAQVRHTANAPLPHFGDLDPSGRYGGDDGRRPLRVTVLGDSSMTGPGLSSPADIWIARAAGALGRPVELRSHARGGSRARDVLEHQLSAVLDDPTDLVVVSVGANDAIHATPLRSYARALDRLLDRLAEVAPVVSLGIGDLSVIPRLPRTFRPVVSRRSVAIDRTHTLVTADRERVVRVPVSKLSDHVFRARGRELFAADLFHPNGHGHSLWAELFGPYLQRALAVQSAGTDGSHDAGGPDAALAVVDLRTTYATAR